MTRELIHVPGGPGKPHPKRELYDASMLEYGRAHEWWDAAEPEERDRYTRVDRGLTWNFLSGVERWTITRDLINAGNLAIADPARILTDALLDDLEPLNQAAIADQMRRERSA